ncbi:MAG: hypothetical protein LKI34_03025 [Bifidobacterium tibiigranuli]|jgi:hypothetical protein|uniref:hypothetical protein n=1 Tax=Bifidobacterium tibiigranuli TaxID=2172043 RepID=UPI0026EFE607|nr:hypothetical protein [Bifidobacterium tibiigranuli]MCI1673180.1 hypothetical protein [Bifidobacterium tibiigranuli]MCI1713575.1 hypothetical protein [Bifidobacterium tibiigranuli]
MSWKLWLMVVWLLLCIVSNVCSVGKRREPMTPGIAAGTVVVLLAQGWLVLSIGGVL